MQQGIGNLAQRPEFGLGDFVSDVFKPVRKVVNKVVPRELQPILPVVASAFLGPMVGNLFGGIAASSPALAAALGAGTTSAFTQALTGSGQIDPASTLISAGIGGIRGFQGPRAGVEKFDYSGATGRTPMVDGQQDVFLRNPQEIEAARQAVEPTFFEKQIEKAQAFTGKANIDPITGKAIFDSDVLGIPTTGTGPESFFKGLTSYGSEYIAKATAEEQLDLAEQERQAGIKSAADKRKDKQIYIDFVMRAGFSREEAERMAEGAGYSEGGRVNAFLGRFFSEGIGQAAKLAERGIKPFGQKQTYKQSVKTTGVSEEQFKEILEKQLNRVPDEVVDQPTGEALYRSLLDAEAVITGQKLGLLTQEQRTQIAKAMKDKVSKQIYDNPVPGMNNDYLEYMDDAIGRMDAILEIERLGGDLTPKPIFDGKEIIGAQVDFKQLDELGDKGKDNIVPFKPKDEKAEGGRIKAQDGDFMGGLEAIMAFAPERGGGVNEEAIAEYMAKIQTGELVYDPETDSFIPAPRKRRRQNTRPADNEEFMSDLMYRMRMNEMYGKKEGGRVELKNGGGKVPGLPPGKQVDAREGMFIPMGGAKRADDVPAMLSVNEFVLNDNAVAGLGKMLTGTPDPRAGARALYKIQDQLEAMVV